jgi:exonuclease VII small subunit
MLERGKEMYERGRKLADDAAEMFERGRKIVESTASNLKG